VTAEELLVRGNSRRRVLGRVLVRGGAEALYIQVILGYDRWRRVERAD
jgi:hypothetical protein